MGKLPLTIREDAVLIDLEGAGTCHVLREAEAGTDNLLRRKDGLRFTGVDRGVEGEMKLAHMLMLQPMLSLAIMAMTAFVTGRDGQL